MPPEGGSSVPWPAVHKAAPRVNLRVTCSPTPTVVRSRFDGDVATVSCSILQGPLELLPELPELPEVEGVEVEELDELGGGGGLEDGA
jgi:hypothetical protein